MRGQISRHRGQNSRHRGQISRQKGGRLADKTLFFWLSYEELKKSYNRVRAIIYYLINKESKATANA